MSKDKISEYAFTPAANTDIGGINIDEGCAPSGINNAIRTLMTQIRDLQAGVSGDTIPLTAGGTGSGTAASARAALGLAIGTNVLGYVTPGASGNVLQSDGSNWTSAAATAVTLDTITGGPLTVAKGGTGATTAAQARTNLGAMQNYTAGATGQVLTSTGTGWVSQAASGGQLQSQTFLSPGTWTVPASTTTVKVTVIGGGGAGHSVPGAPAPSARGGGGGGSGVNIQYITGLTSGASIPVTIGAGGTVNGNSGGTSSIGPFGPGGTVSQTGGAGAPGGTGGAGSVGGGQGFTGTDGSSGTPTVAGIGGAVGNLGSFPAGTDARGLFLSIGGAAKNPSTPSFTPANAGSRGGGGGGASAPTGSNAGAGGGGLVIVEFVG